jgi:hypothetical protein
VDNEAEVIIQLPRDSSIDAHLRSEPPASLTDRRIVLEHLTAGPDGRLTPPETGEVLLTVPSPEGLRRHADELLELATDAEEDGGPLVVVVEGAEYLRDNEIAAALDAAAASKRVLIVCILEGV